MFNQSIKNKISKACHVQDLDKWINQELEIFNTFTKELDLQKKTRRDLKNLFLNGLISYNAIDSIADGESDPKDLNFFLLMLLNYQKTFDSLITQLDLSKQNKIISLRNGINSQYLKCANNPEKIKLYKIQGTRSIPYVLPYVLAIFLSNQSYEKNYQNIIKKCFIFCNIRQTSDDLKDLDEDIINNRITLVTKIFKHYKKIHRNKELNFIKRLMTDKILSILDEQSVKENTIKGNTTQTFNYWNKTSTQILININKYIQSL